LKPGVWCCNLPSRIEQISRFRGADYKWKGELAIHEYESVSTMR
jgi:hypothetical protein